MEDLRYPIGKITFKDSLSLDDRTALIEHIARAPEKLREALQGLEEEQLDEPYRDGGWTVRQVVHHLADSHLNAVLRFRFALTEENPRIMAYDEAVWAQMPDAKTAPIDVSLNLLTSLHQRWVLLLRSLSEHDFTRKLDHPENGPIDLDWMLQMYGWHGQHHAAHITALRARKNW
jgi:uncharacterized damage-inducible protein DinB